MKKLTQILIITLIGGNVAYCQMDSTEAYNFNERKCSYCMHSHRSISSPYTINFKNELPYFATSLGLLATGFVLRNNSDYDEFTLQELEELDPNNVNAFDRPATQNHSTSALKTSDYILYGSISLPLYFLSNHHTGKDITSLLVMGFEVFSISNTLAFNAKFLTDRPRPLAYNSDFSDSERLGKTNKLSFFSGHTAQTSGLFIFTAKVITDYHSDMRPGHKAIMWSVALSVPAYTGYLRVKGGKHFYTDVITGYAVGALVGWIIPELHKKKDSNISLAPYNYDGATGLNLTIKLKYRLFPLSNDKSRIVLAP